MKIVILGKNSFIGKAIIKELSFFDYNIRALGREDLDLSHSHSIGVLNDFISDGDIVISVAAKVPARNYDDLSTNMIIARNISEAVKSKKISLLVNFSSDAVYADSKNTIDEQSTLNPTSYHSLMHINREFILNTSISSPICHIRPTLVFGKGDPHSGYGPNLFIKDALENKKIKLIGNGEELRDHIHVDEVAKITHLIIKNRITGIINAVSGLPLTFHEIASEVARFLGPEIEIVNQTRITAMPHDGIRIFDNSKLNMNFPNLTFIDRKLKIVQVVKEMLD